MKEMVICDRTEHKMQWETKGKGYNVTIVCKIYIHLYFLLGFLTIK